MIAAVVIDPQRDIDRSWRSHASAWWHHPRVGNPLHNDYVTGGLELSRRVGAEYVVPAGDDGRLLGAQRSVDGEIIDGRADQLRVMHTPGHTHHHVSYVLRDDVGQMRRRVHRRIDAVRHHRSHRSARPRAKPGADSRAVPFGSALGRGAARRRRGVPDAWFRQLLLRHTGDGDSSTMAEQRQDNPALTQDEQDFVDELLAGLSAYPAYYAHMGLNQRDGPAPVDLSLPAPVDPANCADGSTPANGSSTCVIAPRSRPATSRARLGSSCRARSSATSAGCTPRAHR